MPASNSANEARMLKNIFPNGSAGSYTVEPICRQAPRLMMRSARERASVGPGEPVKPGDDQGVPGVHGGERLLQPRLVPVPVNPSST